MRIYSTDNGFERADYFLRWVDERPMIEVVGEEAYMSGDPRDDGKWFSISGTFSLREFTEALRRRTFMMKELEWQKVIEDQDLSSFLSD